MGASDRLPIRVADDEAGAVVRGRSTARRGARNRPVILQRNMVETPSPSAIHDNPSFLKAEAEG
jgi:hypothetical protein